MTAATRVPAVGGIRTVPEPDPIARDYILLGLRLEQHMPGLVDAYYGPAALKAQVEMEARRPPASLREDAAALLERVNAEVAEPDRRSWLTAQLVALDTQAAVLAAVAIPYEEQVARSFDFEPHRVGDDVLAAAAGRLDELLPGDGELVPRVAAWDSTLEVAVERLPAVLDWLVDRLRARAEEQFGLPGAERLRISLVRNQPWSAYNWYDGGLQSRFDMNIDLPVHASELVHTVAHEAFPGHHLEHAWKEASLTDEGRVECSLMLINTPECLISEGLADVGVDFASPLADRVALFDEVFERAAVPVASDPVRRREAAERAVALAGARETLRTSRLNGAFMLHADGVARERVLDYLVQVGRYPRDVAEKRLEFDAHPLWRTYIFVYSEGAKLLRHWLDAVPEQDRPGRFARLLHEQLTPGAIRSELRD
jgi:hypothetical protein